MAITLQNAARNAAADAMAALHDGGTLEFHTSGDVEVATVGFGDPAFGAALNGVASSLALTTDPDATGGEVAKFVTKDSGGNVILSGTVGGDGSGADIIIDNVTVPPGSTVALTAFSITQPAS